MKKAQRWLRDTRIDAAVLRATVELLEDNSVGRAHRAAGKVVG